MKNFKVLKATLLGDQQVACLGKPAHHQVPGPGLEAQAPLHLSLINRIKSGSDRNHTATEPQ